MFTQETASSSEEQRSTLPLEPMYTALKLDKSGELNARHVSFIDELDGKKLIQIVGRLLLHVTAVTLPGRESKFCRDFTGGIITSDTPTIRVGHTILPSCMSSGIFPRSSDRVSKYDTCVFTYAVYTGYILCTK